MENKTEKEATQTKESRDTGARMNGVAKEIRIKGVMMNRVIIDKKSEWNEWRWTEPKPKDLEWLESEWEEPGCKNSIWEMS